jgi:curved DNA-binding protein CbpA
MDAIKIEGEYYDPYFILGVTKNDDDKQISKAYKLRAKKYHPDKAHQEDKKKYEKRFKIICKSYEYVKKKRATAQPPKNVPVPQSPDFLTNNEQPELDGQLPNSFGYGETSRLESIEDYEKIDTKIYKQLDKDKFELGLFNKMFEQVKGNCSPSKNAGIIHKTTDGFIGYNTADTDNCYTVHTYKGLLVYGDDFGENGTGYWGNNYSDYKHSYNSAKNPTSKISIRSNVKDTSQNAKNIDFITYKNKREKEKINPTMSNQKFYENKIQQYIEEDEQNKYIVMKYASLFDKKTLQSALEGQLETSTVGLFELLSLE